jgi:hypothetical protein
LVFFPAPAALGQFLYASLLDDAWPQAGIPASFMGETHYSANTYITVLAQTPTLTSTLAGNHVILSWPTWFAGWTLQTNNNLATGTWGSYLGPVGNNSTTSSPAGGNLFFRLTHP